MRDFRDAKSMARRLREALAQRGVALTHTDCLELIARSFGVKDWQVLAAMIETGDTPPAPPAAAAWSGPVLLLRDIVIFPKMTVPVFVGRAMSKLALAEAYQGEQEVLLVTQKDRADDNPAPAAIYGVGVVADVLERTVLPEGHVKLLVRGRQRAAILGISETDGFRRAEAILDPPLPRSGPRSDDLARSAIEALHAYAAAHEKALAPEVSAQLAEVRSPAVLSDLIAAHADLPIADKQRLLEMREPRQRLGAVEDLISQAIARAA